jgi:hypothetical protein
MARERQPLIKQQETVVAVGISVRARQASRSVAIYLVESLLVIAMLVWVSFLSWGYTPCLSPCFGVSKLGVR